MASRQMKLRLIAVGKMDKKMYHTALEEYNKRLQKPWLPEVIEIPSAHERSIDHLKQKEWEKTSRFIKPGSSLFLLDEKGKTMSSKEFSHFMEGQLSTHGEVTLVLGGAYGFAPAAYQRADHCLSLSPLTFSHRLARVILYEQLYRAMSLCKGLPYHNE